MATFEMVYLRGVTEEALAEAWDRVLPGRPAAVGSIPGNPWLQIREIEYELLGQAATALSAHFGCDAVAFASQTTVDALEITQVEAGRVVRHLVYEGGGDGWRVVEGERQLWENVFFEDDDLEQQVAELDDEDPSSASSRRAVEARTPVAGAWLPYVGTLDTIAVGAEMGLPGMQERTGWGPERRLGPARALPAGPQGKVIAMGVVIVVGVGVVFAVVMGVF